MNKRLQAILDLLQKSDSLTPKEKNSLADAVKESDKEITITEFKLERTEKVKRTTGILLEETIAELEQKRKSVEAQNRKLEIEAALERVRSRSIAMRQSSELGDLSFELVKQVQALGIATWHCAFNIYDEDQESSTEWGSNANGSYPIYKTPREGIFRRYYEIGQRGETLHVEVIGEDKCADHYAYLCTLPGVGETLVKLRDSGIPFPKSQIDHVAYFKYGYLLFITFEPAPEAHDIFKRFAKVFEQTYTRFLDLQKAEAQAREAKVEAALEKVRSRSMQMNNSNELRDVIQVVFAQLLHLNFKIDSASFSLNYKESDDFNLWTARPGQPYPTLFHIPYLDHPIFNEVKEAKKKGLDLFSDRYNKRDKDEFFMHFFTHAPQVPKERQEFILSAAGWARSQVLMDTISLFIQNYQGIEYSSEENDILKRFGKVFEQAYTRFLDLQKAEAQTREAQIEASLERVRSKAMAMHKSEDLSAAVAVVFDELDKLDIGMSRCGIGILNKEKRSADVWTTSKSEGQNTVDVSGDESMDIHPLLQKAFDAWLRQEDFNYVLQGEDLADYYTALQHTNFRLPESEALVKNSEMIQHHYYVASFQAGALYAFRENPFSDEAKNVIKRFANVFNLTYKRFQDIQKAEAQARESQIEAALERVRSKTMAMHNSQDVGDTVATLFDELIKLGVKTNRCGILIFSESNDTEVWTAKSNPSGKANLIIGHLDVASHPMLTSARNTWKNKETSFSYEMVGDDLINYYQTISNQPGYRIQVNMDALPSKEIHTEFYFPEGAVFAFTPEAIEVDAAQIFKRLAGVFGQTYRRYLDLQKAESQAREATIEASLERVRAKAMAMHSTADLTATVSTTFIELRNLGIKPLRLGLGIIDRETRVAPLYSATISDDGTGSMQLVGSVLLENHPVLEQIYETWINKSDYFPVLKGELLKSYYEKLRSGFQIPEWHSDYEQYGQFYQFEEGTLYAWTEKPIDPNQTPVFKRFTSVLALTYRRYNELQLSEANAREAIRRASIDRVRAEIASMRTTTDLERITPLIWNELTELGVPFIRCGVFIMDEAQEIIHTFLSTPDGQAIGAFHLPYTTPGRIQMALSSWKKNERYIDRWTEEVFREFADTLVKQGALTSPDQYLSTIPHGGFYLHFLPFLQGMLYVGNMEQLKEDQLELIQTVADAFSTAYARYEDFNKLEAAKQQVDRTLLDLKKTQNQLVISEKMASLGELTAGIAHEIQNPLNFVNNFSEVSNELLEEMKEEIQKGNYDEVQSITDNIRQNLEKILHHGKRADGIVKGMLQHSRNSAGVKEPTDINTLADEYLRLAFHGFRAKDKSFNVTTKTDFDEQIGKINVVPEDIGRVVLNLITNAFYTVSEKKRQSGKDYEPAVALRTKRNDDHILISVIDNGNGISPKVLDKIFQPFFTTKPTGQGTGLGLSLSYDILKAHGGELRVETKEGEGSEFIIQLPVS